jgi:hypothetical protein
MNNLKYTMDYLIIYVTFSYRKNKKDRTQNEEIYGYIHAAFLPLTRLL